MRILFFFVLILSAQVSYSRSCAGFQFSNIKNVYLYESDSQDSKKKRLICEFAFELDTVLTDIRQRYFELEFLSLTIPYEQQGASYNDGAIITIPLRAHKDKVTQKHLRSRYEQITIFIHELGHSVASEFFSKTIPRYRQFKDYYLKKSYYSKKVNQLFERGKYLLSLYRDCLDDELGEYCSEKYTSQFSNIQLEIESAQREEKKYEELSESPEMNKFGLFMKPYHEYFADVFTVLIRRDFLAMYKSFIYPSITSEDQYLAGIRSFAINHEVATWEDAEAYAILAPARSYLGSKITNLTTLSDGEVVSSLESVLSAISDEILFRLENDLDLKNPIDVNRSLIQRLETSL